MSKSFFLLLYFIIQITKAAAERNELLRSAFIVEIGGYMPEQSIFIDESAKDERNLSRRYGYSYVNTRARLRVAFVRGKRYSILPALTLDGIVAVEVIEGSYNKNAFQEFIISQVVCTVYYYTS